MVRVKVVFFSSFLAVPRVLPFFTGFAAFAMIFYSPSLDLACSALAFLTAITTPNRYELFSDRHTFKKRGLARGGAVGVQGKGRRC